MDESIIDLCDSDEDNDQTTATVVNINTNKNFKIDRRGSDDDSSSSSSSSDDSHLWNAGGFLKGSPQRGDGGVKTARRGNYFKEVRSKYNNSDDDIDGGKKMKRRKFGSPIVSQEGAGDEDESSDHDAPIQKEQFNYGERDKKRNLSSDKPPSKKSSSSLSPSKQRKTDERVECIEIDLSDSSSDDGADNEKNGASEKRSDVDQSSKPNSKSTMSYKEDNDDSELEESDFDAEFRIQQNKPSPAAKKKAQNNPYSTKTVQNSYNTNNTSKKKSYDSDDSSSHSSDSTISLAEEKRLKKKKNVKGRVSFNDSDDIEHFIADNHDDGVEDFSFDMEYGGFDEDGDQLPSTTTDASCDKKESGKALAKSKANPKTIMKPKSSDDVEVFDIDSDDDSSSNSSAELFTPRPFKKIAKKPAAACKLEEHSARKSMEKKCPNSSSSAKLLTPRAFSPATTSPTLGAYASLKRTVPTPAIPAMSTALVKEIGGKLYPDLRHNFLVALTSHARRLRHNSYQRASFDSALRSVVVISLHMRPLRSAEAARRIKGVGSNFYELLKESITGPKGKKPFAPANGKFSCVAAAALVALLELEEAGKSVASANGTGSFPLEDVIRKINELLDARANASLNQSAEKYLDPNNLDPGFGQLKKLASANAAADLGGPFIKERKKKDACASGRVYEILDSGRELARKLRQLARLGPAEPGPLRQLPDETVDEEFGQVTMSMDFREGGGGGKSLHKMCDQLDIRGVPYVVRELKIADYIFFVGDKLAPILIERKTVDDVASSLHDGRWERQQRSMRKAQYVLGGGPARRCQICYIVEGDAAKRTVHGGNVGRRTYFQSLEDVESAIEQLPSLGFSVMKSKGHLGTIGILAKVAQDVSWKAKNGSIDTNFTYKQFLSRVKVLSDEIGDPPTSEHQNPAPPVVTAEENIPGPSSNVVAAPDDDSFSPQSNVQNDVQPTTSSVQTSRDENSEEQSELKSELNKLSIAKLKERCKERDEKIGGKKEDLIARLLKPRKPELLIMRARRKEYVPKVPSCNAALMVALLLNHVPGTQGMAKERLMVLAEETGISKESMSGDGGSFYDGWSGVKQLQEGDPALVRREKGHRYSLTTQPPETSGRAVAHALHIVAHREKMCNCSSNPE
ncbi:hypothetical protein ACHAXR_007312 [Thalassiosira sp. AJA248-18]